MNTLLAPKYKVDPSDHLGLVCKIIHTNFNKRLKTTPIRDSVEYSDGVMGLVRACITFDESRGFQFSTYAGHCIRNSILEGYRTRREASWESENSSNVVIYDSEHPSLYSAENNLSQSLYMTQEDIQRKREIVEHYLKTLNICPRRQLVLKLRMEGMKLREIALELKITRERVRQLEQEVLHSLNKVVRKED